MSLSDLVITAAHSRDTTNEADNRVYIKAMIDDKPQFQVVEFQDNFTTDYSTTQVFGRMDPIVNYKGTTRKITLGIRSSSADTTQEIKVGMKRLQYPVYESAPSGITNALAIQRPPLVFVHFGDLIHGLESVDDPLLCALTGFSNSPRVGLTPLDSPLVVFGAQGNSVTFTETTFRFDLIPLHDSTPGFIGDVPNWVGGIL